jgi:lantibiotic modifying enzyme
MTDPKKIRRIIIALVCQCFTAAVSTAGESFPLDAALMAASWLDAVAIKTPQGLSWPADPRDASSINNTLYSGTPGVILFYLEAFASTKNQNFLSQARAGARDLAAHLREENGTGLYEGIAGIGFALEETFKATKRRQFREGFLISLKILQEKARPIGRGVEWSTVTDIISGSAGTGLFLLYAYRELREKAWLDLAEKAGRRLIELGKPKNGGLDWAMDPEYPRLMPNFSHGTAGVAYFLAALYMETRKKEYLDASLAGAKYLQSIAKTEGDICLIFHHEPEGKDLYYLGWCHGPVGTANLFFRLYEITGDKIWLDWVRKSARGIILSGIPEKETAGFWNNDGLCCGLAGVGDFFLNIYSVTKDKAYLDFCRRVTAKLLAKATVEGRSMNWIQAEHRTQPNLLAAQTGLMQGAAGIGLFLLHLDNWEKHKKPLILFPDSAFAD